MFDALGKTKDITYTYITSLLDNAPNYLVGCIIQKRSILLCCDSFITFFPFFPTISNGHPHGQRRKRQSQGPDNRISYTETHIPLQKGIDDCIDDHANNSTGTVMTPMLAEHERNPDIIPINSRDSKCQSLLNNAPNYLGS